MSAIIKPAQDVLDRTRQAAHSTCIVCSQSGECGMGLNFVLRQDGIVETVFECKALFQGYDGILHGGIVSSLLDGAMTNCLFAHGITAVTAEMTVRFRHPIMIGVPALVRGYITRTQLPLYIVEAQIIQDGKVRAKAAGKFMERNK